jgi:hypothetical protein
MERRVRGQIFHSPGLKTQDAFFAFLRNDELVVKLPAHRGSALVAAMREACRFVAALAR